MTGETNGRDRRRTTALVVAAVVAVVAGTVAAVQFLGDGGDPGQDAEPAASPAPAPPAPTASASPDGPTAQPRTVPVYYLADSGGSLRLYREFHRVTTSRAPAEAAVREMLAADARDPDYRSLWPDGTELLGLTRSGDTATVDLSAEARRNAGAGAEGEALSVQQLVYTVTAAEPEIRRVRLLVDGEAVTDLWGHGAVGTQPLTRAPALDVQGLVWILAPEEGAEVKSPVAVRVFGTAFEGNVILKVFRGEAEVASTHVTTAMGEFREASTTIRLPTGAYTLRAYDEDARDGGLVERDSKAFTVTG